MADTGCGGSEAARERLGINFVPAAGAPTKIGCELATYLRPMGSKVSSIYGGGFDEPFQAAA